MEDEKEPYDKMQEGMKEIFRLNLKVKEYKKRIKAGDFNFKIEFETELSRIKLSELKTPLDESVIVINDYEVVVLDVDKLVCKHVTKPDKIFPKNKLWVVRSPHTMARLIEFVEAGNKLFPAIVEPIEKYDDIAIIDGNHRIALFRFLELSKAPFLVKKNLIHLVNELK